jgi:hypothetical protein
MTFPETALLLLLVAACTGGTPPSTTPSSADTASTADTSAVVDTHTTNTERIEVGWPVWETDRQCWASYVEDLPASIWYEWDNSCNGVLDSPLYPPNITRYWMTNLEVCAEFNEPLVGECAVDVDYFEACDSPLAGPCCDLPESNATKCFPDEYYQP